MERISPFPTIKENGVINKIKLGDNILCISKEYLLLKKKISSQYTFIKLRI